MHEIRQGPRLRQRLPVRRRPATSPAAQLDALAREMCDRHTGIGADGLIVYETARRRASDAAVQRRRQPRRGVRQRRAGARRARSCATTRRPTRRVTIQTEAGAKHADADWTRRIARRSFRAAMGAAGRRLRQVCPSTSAGESRRPGRARTSATRSACCSDRCRTSGRFRRLGAALERHAMFPEGTNVEFAQVEAPDRVRILIWERGVGPTSSSGTGSCAALVAAAAFGGAARDAEVIAPGGAQRVEWRADSVYLTGWAEVLVRGRVAAADSAYRVTATAWQFLNAAFQRRRLAAAAGRVASRSLRSRAQRGYLRPRPQPAPPRSLRARCAVRASCTRRSASATRCAAGGRRSGRAGAARPAPSAVSASLRAPVAARVIARSASTRAAACRRRPASRHSARARGCRAHG